jgi:hypothetical protein
MTEHRLGNCTWSRRSVAMLAKGTLNSYREMMIDGAEIRLFG